MLLLIGFFLSLSLQAQDLTITSTKGGAIFSLQLNRNLKQGDKISPTSQVKFSSKDAVLYVIFNNQPRVLSIDHASVKAEYKVVNTAVPAQGVMLPAGASRGSCASFLEEIFLGITKEDLEAGKKPQAFLVLPQMKVTLPKGYEVGADSKYIVKFGEDEQVTLKSEGTNILSFDKYIYIGEEKTYTPAEVKEMALGYYVQGSASTSFKFKPVWVEATEAKASAQIWIDALKGKPHTDVVNAITDFFKSRYGHTCADAIDKWLKENMGY